MNSTSIRNQGEPKEAVIQKRIIEALQIRGWECMVTHGNMFQKGFPDLYIFRRPEGSRWVEVKRPNKWRFTSAQINWFHKMAAAGIGIWVLMGHEQSEIDKLYKAPNWYLFLDIIKELSK